VSPGWPNGETRSGASPITQSQGCEQTEGTETSQYLEEEKSTEMPRVAASEIGTAQTTLLVGVGL
jgi:hypothetical protein